MKAGRCVSYIVGFENSKLESFGLLLDRQIGLGYQIDLP